jgi:hypothetical protein
LPNQKAPDQPQNQQPPVIVNITPAPKSDSERAEEVEDRRKKAETDTRLTNYTGELAFFTKGLFLATVVLGIATIGLLIAAFFQSRDMKASITAAKDAASAARDQVELSRHALISVERAMVFLSKTHCMADVKRSTGQVIDWTFYAILENAGSTPTRNMFMHTNWYYFAGGMPEDFAFHDISSGPVERVPVAMGPKSTTWSGECEVPIDIIQATRKKEGQLYLWGWVEYDDIFEGTPRHRTEYCMQVNVVGDPTTHELPGTPGSPHVPFLYQGHKKYNGLDEECMRPIQTASSKRAAQA